jgi:hypothetical protein
MVSIYPYLTLRIRQFIDKCLDSMNGFKYHHLFYSLSERGAITLKWAAPQKLLA